MKEPDIIQRISADFHTSGGIFNVKVSSNKTNFTPDFGSVYVVHDSSKIFYATKETWDSQPQYITKKGCIYIYSDLRTDKEGRLVAGMKVGDGQAYLIDMPFVDEIYADHISDMTIHITQEEREFWNNKIRCVMTDSGELIFTIE